MSRSPAADGQVSPLSCRSLPDASMKAGDSTLLAATEEARENKVTGTISQYFSQELIRPSDSSLYLEKGEQSGGRVAIVDGAEVAAKQIFCAPGFDGDECPQGSLNSLRSFDIPRTKVGLEVSFRGDSISSAHVQRAGKLIFDSEFLTSRLTRGIASPISAQLLSYGANQADGVSARESLTEAMKQIFELNSNSSTPTVSVLNISMAGGVGSSERNVLGGICRYHPPSDSELDPRTAAEKETADPLESILKKNGVLPSTASDDERAYFYWRRLEIQGKTLFVFASGNGGAPVEMEHGRCGFFSNALFVGGASSYSGPGRWAEGAVTGSDSKIWRNSQGSNFGDSVTVDAQVDPMIWDSARKNSFDDEMGTSFSAPQVAGATLIIQRVNDELSAVSKALVLEVTASVLPSLLPSLLPPLGEKSEKKRVYPNGLPFLASRYGMVNLPLAAAVSRELKRDPKRKQEWRETIARCGQGCRGDATLKQILIRLKELLAARYRAENPVTPLVLPRVGDRCDDYVRAYESAMNGFLMTDRALYLKTPSGSRDVNPYFRRVCEIYRLFRYDVAASFIGCSSIR
ncbi:MAG: S8/S53 family peptidase [Cryobacterium sp.]|nr:S8/S53 family peptidase [Oligoflexia bacterium]